MRRLVPLVLFFVLWVPGAHAWTWPVTGPVLQGFSFDPAHPYAGGQHRGIDIGASATGIPVMAPASGVVSYAGTVPTSGKSVTIETAEGLSVTLTHLGSYSVTKNATVSEGDVVGTVGPSGTPDFDQPYLHLGVRTTADPQGYLDPLGFLPSLAPPAPPPAPAPDPAPAPALQSRRRRSSSSRRGRDTAGRRATARPGVAARACARTCRTGVCTAADADIGRGLADARSR